MKIREILNEEKSVADLNLNYKGDNFLIYNLGLTSLEGSPKIITGNFICYKNKLTTLEGGPQIVKGYYDCDENQLKSLKGAPQEISSFFSCANNKLLSLQYAPKIINQNFYCSYNLISSLKNIFQHINLINGRFSCENNPIKEGLLHVLLIKGVKNINSPFQEIDYIINNYLKTNKSGTAKAMFDVQKLIIEAKLKDVPESIYME